MEATRETKIDGDRMKEEREGGTDRMATKERKKTPESKNQGRGNSFLYVCVERLVRVHLSLKPTPLSLSITSAFDALRMQAQRTRVITAVYIILSGQRARCILFFSGKVHLNAVAFTDNVLSLVFPPVVSYAMHRSEQLRGCCARF